MLQISMTMSNQVFSCVRYVTRSNQDPSTGKWLEIHQRMALICQPTTENSLEEPRTSKLVWTLKWLPLVVITLQKEPRLILLLPFGNCVKLVMQSLLEANQISKSWNGPTALQLAKTKMERELYQLLPLLLTNHWPMVDSLCTSSLILNQEQSIGISWWTPLLRKERQTTQNMWFQLQESWKLSFSACGIKLLLYTKSKCSFFSAP